MSWYTDLADFLSQEITELKNSVDGDTPEYRMARIQHIGYLADTLAKNHDVLSSVVGNNPAGSFERITRGTT